MQSSMALSSQSPRESAGYTLQQRKLHFRIQREQKHSKQSRNPIVNSIQYQAYRERATREGNPDDQKWPDILEDAFLDGMPFIQIRHTLLMVVSFARDADHGKAEVLIQRETSWPQRTYCGVPLDLLSSKPESWRNPRSNDEARKKASFKSHSSDQGIPQNTSIQYDTKSRDVLSSAN